jgi:type VI secretion system protein ImpM
MGPGYFGKFPSHGDFITRRLPRDGFLNVWDSWLQNALATSRKQLGEAWLPTYLTSPVWRFALSAGVCGPLPWAGIMMPSVDSVGRYFPLTLASAVTEKASPLHIAGELTEWYDTLEDLVLKVLDDSFDLQQFDSHIAAWTIPPLSATTEFGVSRQIGGDRSAAVYIELHADQNPSTAYPALLDHLLHSAYENYSMWWTSGSDQVAPCLLTCDGLPPAQGFAALLGGNCSDASWQFRNEDSSVIGTINPPSSHPR